MNSTGTPKIDRTGLTDAQYIAALERSNKEMANELYRLRQEVLKRSAITAEFFDKN